MSDIEWHMVGGARADEEWHDLVGRLARLGIHYFATSPSLPGSSEHASSNDAGDEALVPLILDLARSRHAHLRDALIALLLRHPVATEAARSAAGRLAASDPARQFLLLSVVVAAALQREWAFTLDIYLPNQPTIEADDLAAQLELPSPDEDYGRPCLMAVANALAGVASFPFNYRAGWEGAARRLLAQLRQDAHRGAA